MKIALCGVAGSGKGTVASIIAKYVDGVVIGSFAYPIKHFLRLLLNLTDEHIYGHLKEVPLTFRFTPESFDAAASFYIESGLDDLVSFDRMWFRFLEVFADNLRMEDYGVMFAISSRRLQQLFGTEVMRYNRESVWVDFALSKGYNVIDDLRFENEEVALKAAGYKIVKIVGKESRLSGSADALHPSEAHIPYIVADCVIDNDHEEYNESSLRYLEEEVVSILERLGYVSPGK